MKTTNQTTEIIVKSTAIGNPNVTQAMEDVKKVKNTEGTILGINFLKIMHQIILF